MKLLAIITLALGVSAIPAAMAAPEPALAAREDNLAARDPELIQLVRRGYGYCYIKKRDAAPEPIKKRGEDEVPIC